MPNTTVDSFLSFLFPDITNTTEVRIRSRELAKNRKRRSARNLSKENKRKKNGKTNQCLLLPLFSTLLAVEWVGMDGNYWPLNGRITYLLKVGGKLGCYSTVEASRLAPAANAVYTARSVWLDGSI